MHTEVKQYNLWQILLMFLWPTLWFTFLAYVVGPLFVPAGGVTPTWVFLCVLVLGNGAEMLVGLLLLRREGYELKLSSLRERIRWAWPSGWKQWGIVVAVFVAGMTLSMLAGPLNKALANTPGFHPPSFWPNASNPLVEITGAADVFPDVNLAGNYGFFLIYFLITLIFNIFGEELYYRGFLLPKMRGALGKWDWVVNGVLFTLKHAYQRWMYPGILIGGLAFAFAAGPLGSLPLAMIYHWAGNFLINIVFLLLTVMGVM